MSDDPHRGPANENHPSGRHPDHWCEHPGCKRWGSFGVPVHGEPHWFCGEHNPETERERLSYG